MSNLLMKVIAWRLLSFLVSMIINCILFGDVARSFWITAIVMGIFTVLHYIFEVTWSKFFLNVGV